MNRGAWWATVHRVTKSQTWLKHLSMHTCSYPQSLEICISNMFQLVDLVSTNKGCRCCWSRDCTLRTPMLGKLGGLRHSLKDLFCLQDSNLLISWGKVRVAISETMLSGPELTEIGLFLEEEGMDIFDSVAILGDCIWSSISLKHLSHIEPGPPPARLEVTGQTMCNSLSE